MPQGEWLCPRCRAIREIKIFNKSHHHRTKMKLNNHECLNNNNIININNNNNSNSNYNKISIDNYKYNHKEQLIKDKNFIVKDAHFVEKFIIETNGVKKSDGRKRTHDDHNLIEPSNNQFDTIETCRKIRLLSKLWDRDNPFTQLVKISLSLNPREYSLPEDYIPDVHFPGSSKKTQTISQHLSSSSSSSSTTIAPSATTSTTNSAFANSREGRLTLYSVKRAQELDRDNLPSILRTCFLCRKGWRKAPLINCDYCPLIYHADCIDPPLTNIPVTRWMCPSHIEPIVEQKLLSSSSFSERVNLWTRFSKPIDHESITSSFLKKIRDT